MSDTTITTGSYYWQLQNNCSNTDELNLSLVIS